MPRFTLDVVTCSDVRFVEAVKVENKVFMRAFNNGPEMMEHEYGPYRDSSVFLLVYDKRRNVIAGFMRLIHDSAAGLKSLNDLESPPWGGRTIRQVLTASGIDLAPSKTLDIATLGIELGYRKKDSKLLGAIVSTALYYALVQYSLKHQIKHWVAILDDNVLDIVQKTGAKFNLYNGITSAKYLDSPSSTPVWNDFEDAIRSATWLHKLIFISGTGITLFVKVPKVF